MHHVQALGKVGLPEFLVLAHSHLRGLGLAAGLQAAVELCGGGGLVKIIHVLLAVHLVMKANIWYSALRKEIALVIRG